jgi:hypothetical protein
MPKPMDIPNNKPALIPTNVGSPIHLLYHMISLRKKIGAEPEMRQIGTYEVC